jgi:hypothetical protein
MVRPRRREGDHSSIVNDPLMVVIRDLDHVYFIHALQLYDNNSTETTDLTLTSHSGRILSNQYEG